MRSHFAQFFGDRLGFAWFGSVPMLAQAQSAQADQPSSTPAANIVVMGQTPAVRSSIDRKIYSTTRDLQASSRSVSDVLRNLPSVDVDAQGNVSLRGDTNVQILIDGRPLTLVSGTNRAEALQQLPTDSIESVEVITNPSAQFRPDGSSGLIDIITKKNRKPGCSGMVQGSAGTDGRLNAGISGAYNRGALSLAGGVGSRSGFSYTAKGSADIRLSGKDLFQLSVNQAGRRLTGQGYRLANGFANIGYRRQLTPALTAVMTVSDIFNSQRERSTTDTATFHDFTLRRRSRRAASLALTWRFGGTTKATAPARFGFDN